VVDKRRSLRKVSLTKCTVERLFTNDDSLTSRVVNYSDNGLMLELDYYLQPGDAIKVRFPTDTPPAEEFPNASCIGMVRWCVRQEGSCCGMYGVGVELANQAPRRYA